MNIIFFLLNLLSLFFPSQLKATSSFQVLRPNNLLSSSTSLPLSLFFISHIHCICKSWNMFRSGSLDQLSIEPSPWLEPLPFLLWIIPTSSSLASPLLPSVAILTINRAAVVILLKLKFNITSIPGLKPCVLFEENWESWQSFISSTYVGSPFIKKSLFYYSHAPCCSLNMPGRYSF